MKTNQLAHSFPEQASMDMILYDNVFLDNKDILVSFVKEFRFQYGSLVGILDEFPLKEQSIFGIQSS